ncbi:MAG: AAA family ATPase [Flammeovirgaceae bacterium]
MPIDSLYINNFKSIRDSGEIKIRPLNVLVGSNGAGKSNFISFFKLLHSIVINRLPNYIAESGYADRILHFGRKQSKELSGGIIFRENRKKPPSNRYDFVLMPDQNNSFYFSEEKGGYNNHVNMHWKRHPDWDYIYLESRYHKSDLPRHGASRFSYLRDYFEEFRLFHFHDTSSSAPLKQPAKLRDNAYLKEDGSNLAAFLYRIQEQHPSNFRLIEYAVSSIAPFFERFDLQPDNLNPEMIFLKWLEKNSDEYFDANSLSDGSIRFIALATLLLQPEPPKTIIIDEPELGLHPSAIHQLAALIQSASVNSQIIIATQSTTLLDQFSVEDIIVVDREDNQSTFKRLNEADFSNWLEDYSMGELWGKNVIGGTP